jgi:hypothetical protein
MSGFMTTPTLQRSFSIAVRRGNPAASGAVRTAAPGGPGIRIATSVSGCTRNAPEAVLAMSQTQGPSRRTLSCRIQATLPASYGSAANGLTARPAHSGRYTESTSPLRGAPSTRVR